MFCNIADTLVADFIKYTYTFEFEFDYLFTCSNHGHDYCEYTYFLEIQTWVLPSWEKYGESASNRVILRTMVAKQPGMVINSEGTSEQN